MAIRILASTDSNENTLQAKIYFTVCAEQKHMGFKMRSTLNSSMASAGILTYSSFSQTLFYNLQHSCLKKIIQFIFRINEIKV